MQKYIYNTIDHNSEDGRNEDQNIASEPTMRNQMRGFELIMNLFEHITLQDWLKVQNRMTSSHFQKSELIDLEIDAQIIQSVHIINENNFNVLVLATNEKS